MEWRNSEHYLDPTAAEALANVECKERAKSNKYRPLAYICSPYAGEIEYNLRRARGYCRVAVSKGYIPLAPHLHFPQFMDDGNAEERKRGMFFALVLLNKCEEVWVFGSQISEGMAREINEAERRNIRLRRFTEKGEEEPGI